MGDVDAVEVGMNRSKRAQETNMNGLRQGEMTEMILFQDMIQKVLIQKLGQDK